MMSQGLHIEAHDGDGREWDSFVDTATGGTFFHRIGWKEVLEREFGFRSHYLQARRDGVLAALLPLFEVGGGFGRPSLLLSLPFAVEGGICGDDGEARAALEAAAIEMQRQRGARALELRDGLDGDSFQVREGTYFRFRRTLAPTDEENLAAVPRKQRRMIRVAEGKGLVPSFDKAHLDVFYDLYARSVRDLGTPVFPPRFFRHLLQRFPEASSLLTVWHGDLAVAGVLSFYFRDIVLPYYSGSRREYRDLAANDFMYWQLMRDARERGCRTFDFGRSKKGSGAFAFKCHWGFEPEALRYRVHTDGAPLVERTTAAPHLRLLQQTWRRLPLPVTKWIGPFFLRRFGAQYT